MKEGGAWYNNLTEKESTGYPFDLDKFLRIGLYNYSIYWVQLRLDVCVDVTSGAMWLIDTNRESVINVTIGEDGELHGTTIPIYLEYLNKNSGVFTKSVIKHVQLLDKLSQGGCDALIYRDCWQKFEEYLAVEDVTALEDQGSYWNVVLGRALEEL